MNYKVIFIANYIPDKQISMQKAACLYKEIAEESGIGCKLIRPVDRIGKLRTYLPKLNKWLSYIDKYIIFPIELVIYSVKLKRKTISYTI